LNYAIAQQINAHHIRVLVGIAQRHLAPVASPIGDAARSLLPRRSTSRETLFEQWLPYMIKFCASCLSPNKKTPPADGAFGY
jgi:hypothetical protein